jgi:hypothetical protein
LRHWVVSAWYTPRASESPVVAEPLALPVSDGACRPQRTPAVPHRVEQLALAAYVQQGRLLAGEARAGQVLCGRAGADRHRRRAERPVGSQDRFGQIVRQGQILEERGDARRGSLGGARIVGPDVP